MKQDIMNAIDSDDNLKLEGFLRINAVYANLILNEQGDTPLIYSAKMNKRKCVRTLCNYENTNIQTKDKSGRKALDYVAKDKYPDICAILIALDLSERAVITEKESVALVKVDALEVALVNAKSKHWDKVINYLEDNADMFINQEWLSKLVSIAVAQNTLKVIERLLDAGAIFTLEHLSLALDNKSADIIHLISSKAPLLRPDELLLRRAKNNKWTDIRAYYDNANCYMLNHEVHNQMLEIAVKKNQVTEVCYLVEFIAREKSKGTNKPLLVSHHLGIRPIPNDAEKYGFLYTHILEHNLIKRIPKFMSHFEPIPLSCLRDAANKGFWDGLLEYIDRKGFSIYPQDEAQYLLTQALKQGRCEAVQFLLNKDILPPNVDQLKLAFVSDQPNLVRLIFEKNEIELDESIFNRVINKKKWGHINCYIKAINLSTLPIQRLRRLLHCVIEQNEESLLQLFTRAILEFNSVDLHCAFRHKNHIAIRFLLNEAANLRYSASEGTLLDLMKSTSWPCLSAYLEKVPNVEVARDIALAMLKEVIKQKNPEGCLNNIIKFCLDSNARLQGIEILNLVKNEIKYWPWVKEYLTNLPINEVEEQRPLINELVVYAIKQSDVGMVQFLLEKGADPKHRHEDSSLIELTCCAREGKEQLIKELAKKGAPCNNSFNFLENIKRHSYKELNVYLVNLPDQIQDEFLKLFRCIYIKLGQGKISQKAHKKWNREVNITKLIHYLESKEKMTRTQHALEYCVQYFDRQHNEESYKDVFLKISQSEVNRMMGRFKFFSCSSGRNEQQDPDDEKIPENRHGYVQLPAIELF